MLRVIRDILKAHKVRMARKRLKQLLRPYDDAIAYAEKRHWPTLALRQAKTDFVHSMLRAVR